MTFHLDNDASSSGTRLRGYFRGIGNDIEEAVGAPNKLPRARTGDGRVTREWIFRQTDTDKVVTLYEYKETSVYGDGVRPTPDELMAAPHEWHVGAIDNDVADEFVVWLGDKMDPPDANQA